MSEHVLVAGGGRVGRALAKALEAAGCRVSRWSRGAEPGAATRPPDQTRVEGGAATRPPNQMQATVAIVAVTDSAIGEVAARLVEEGRIDANTVLLHTAGGMPPSRVFSTVKGRIAGAGVMHPLRAIAGREQDADLRGVVFGVCGDETARQAALSLVDRLGGVPLILDETGLSRYHAAAVLAGNHPLALVEAATRILVEAGLNRRVAEGALAGLLASAAGAGYFGRARPVRVMWSPGWELSVRRMATVPVTGPLTAVGWNATA